VTIKLGVNRRQSPFETFLKKHIVLCGCERLIMAGAPRPKSVTLLKPCGV